MDDTFECQFEARMNFLCWRKPIIPSGDNINMAYQKPDYTLMTSYIGRNMYNESFEFEGSCDSFFDENVSFKNKPTPSPKKLTFEYLFKNYGLFYSVEDEEKLKKKYVAWIDKENYRYQAWISLNYIKSHPQPELRQLEDKFVFLPPRLPHQKKTLIFDLDETLIHSYHFWIEEDTSLITASYVIDNEVWTFKFSVRPHAVECLEAANKFFQIVIFTASLKVYADAILNILDPENKLIHHRLYRDSWYTTEDGNHIKDLRIIQNVELQDLAIVDNAIHSFGYQLNNGIPILNYYNNEWDKELYHLASYFEILSECNDVRILNKDAFQVRKIYKNLSLE